MGKARANGKPNVKACLRVPHQETRAKKVGERESAGNLSSMDPDKEKESKRNLSAGILVADKHSVLERVRRHAVLLDFDPDLSASKMCWAGFGPDVLDRAKEAREVSVLVILQTFHRSVVCLS